MAHDFWMTSGWHLTQRTAEGRAVPTADFMAAYFARDEVARLMSPVMPREHCTPA